MVDTVSSQVLVDGERNYVIKLNCLSDGTGESGVKKVDLTTMHPVPTSVRLERVQGDIFGMEVELWWEASSNVEILKMADHRVELDFCETGGLPNTKAAGWTGNMLLTTTDASAGDSYSIVLHFKKKFTDGRYGQE